MRKRARAAAVAAFIPLAGVAMGATDAVAKPKLQPPHQIKALCKAINPVTEACRSGRNEHTRGGPGTGLVSHAKWPYFNGVLFRVRSLGRDPHSFVAGPEHDKLMGHHGNDSMWGEGKSDVLWGDYDPKNNNTTQRDYLNGGAGDDHLYASHGRNILRGGPGNDFLQAYYGRGVLDCGPGRDTVKIRRKSKAYKLRSCERRTYTCRYGNNGNGRCLKKPSSAARARR